LRRIVGCNWKEVIAGLRKLHSVYSHYFYFSTKHYLDEIVNETDVDKYVEWIAEMKTAYKILVMVCVWERVVWRLSTDEKIVLKWWPNTNGACNIWCSEMAILCVACWTSTMPQNYWACVTVRHIKPAVWMLSQ